MYIIFSFWSLERLTFSCMYNKKWDRKEIIRGKANKNLPPMAIKAKINFHSIPCSLAPA